MTKARSDLTKAKRPIGEEPTSDIPFVLGLSMLAFGMLALLAVLVLAGDRGLGGVLPLFALPLVLLAGSAVILGCWALAEAQVAAARAAAFRQASRGRRRP
jgi:hypothetical protein